MLRHDEQVDNHDDSRERGRAKSSIGASIAASLLAAGVAAAGNLIYAVFQDVPLRSGIEAFGVAVAVLGGAASAASWIIVSRHDRPRERKPASTVSSELTVIDAVLLQEQNELRRLASSSNRTNE